MIELDRYKGLRNDIEQTLAEGVARAEVAVYKERIRTYWEVGDRLDRYLQTVDATYGEQTVARLSKDVNLSRRILYDALKFRRLAPKVPAQAQLTWSHYRRLISVKDESLQQRLLESAQSGGWSLNELNRQIRDTSPEAVLDQQPNQVSASELQAKRGEPFVYRTIEKRRRLTLDLGFRDYHPVPGMDTERLTVNQVVRSVPDARREGDYRIEDAGMRSRMYAYPATVERIIDGDTLWATIDLGFGVWADRKLRMRGIDTPEMKTAGGVRARDWLVKRLDEVEVFVVTTTKVDLYDRYLADLFVLPGETDPVRIAKEGRFVNRELVEEGLARLWTGEKPPEF